jgi:hypothetical protein
MEMDRLGIAIVNLAFGLGQELESLESECLGGATDGSVSDDLAYLLKAAMDMGRVGLRGGRVRVGVSLMLVSVSFVLMRVSLVPVRVGMSFVSVGMLMLVWMAVVEVERLVSVAVDEDIDFGRGDPAAFDTVGCELGVEAEAASDGLQCIERDACIYGCAEEHVAADSGEAVKVGNTHWDPDGRLPEIQV